jgi:carbon starvation protein
MSVLVCFLWGYLLYRGDLKTLWKMLGIANQLLATTALAVGTTYVLLHAPKRIYALCTAVPFVFLVVTTFTATVMSLQLWWTEIGALQAKLDSHVLAAASEIQAAEKQVFMWWLVFVLAVIMLLLVAVIVVDSLRRWWQILAAPVRVAELQAAAK